MTRRIRSLVAMPILLLGLGIATIGFAQTIQRGPYLQSATPTSLVVRWRSDQPVDSVVRYGTAAGNLNQSAVGTTGPNHEVTLTGLQPETRYYYSVGTASGPLAGDSTYTFETGPQTGVARPTRIWVVGDSGEANTAARNVRDAYTNFTVGRETNLWLMLGDNAYSDGTDAEYQEAVFDIYPTLLRQSPVWSTLGNHDGKSASSASQSGPYYDIFTLPKNGEAGGLASGTEAFYSFDYSNIHFIVLDSYDTDRSVNGTMLSWLENDLAVNQQDWLIAFWHHPPYTKGSHNSDSESALIDMRENALPLLESYGVDLVLSGHSHSYERSYLIDGHYGTSLTFNASMQVDAGSGRENDTGAYTKGAVGASNAGAVYAVAGSSSKTGSGSLDHPAMFLSLKMLGSMVIDVDNLRLDARFLDDAGNVLDYFTLRQDGGAPLDTQAPSSPGNLSTTAVTAGGVSLQWDAATDNVAVTGYRISRGGQTVATVAATSFDDSGLQPSVSYDYGVQALDAAGNESAAAGITVVTGAAAADTEPPTSPANLRSTTVTVNSISVQWSDAADNVAVTGYRITRDGQTIATVAATSFDDSGLLASTSYRYGVRALDAAGNESAEVSIAIATSASSTITTTPPNADNPQTTVTPASSSGGGGAIDWLLLAALAMLVPRRRRQALQ